MNDNERLERPELKSYTKMMYFKKYWYITVIAIIMFPVAVIISLNVPIENNGLFALTMVGIGIVPTLFAMLHYNNKETKFIKARDAEYKRWENEPEIKKERREYAETSLTFHHAGYITGGVYMLKEQVPKYKDIKNILCDEDNLLIIELTDDQKEKLKQ